MFWIVVSKSPVENAEEVDKLTLRGVESPTSKVRSQFKAAKQAATTLVEQGKGKHNLNLSGYASGKDDALPDRISVEVVSVDA